MQFCIEPGCPITVTRGRCAAHTRAYERTIRRTDHRFYDTKRWELARERQLADHPLCQCDNPSCERIATQVHHIVDRADGGEPYHPDNLQSLTHACHSRITRARL